MSRAMIAVAWCVPFIAGGCGGQDRMDARSRSLNVAAVDTGSDNVQSATGHVEFIGRQGADNRYSFSAIKRVQPSTDETVIQGEVQYQSHRPDGSVVDAHGTVICVEIDGNVARVGAEADHTSGLPEGFPGFAYFTVVDNGEGDNAALPDMASNPFTGTEAVVRQHCETGHVPAPPL